MKKKFFKKDIDSLIQGVSTILQKPLFTDR